MWMVLVMYFFLLTASDRGALVDMRRVSMHGMAAQKDEWVLFV